VNARAEVRGQVYEGRYTRARVEISYSYFKIGNKFINNRYNRYNILCSFIYY
jgi:hypothetical protein